MFAQPKPSANSHGRLSYSAADGSSKFTIRGCVDFRERLCRWTVRIAALCEKVVWQRRSKPVFLHLHRRPALLVAPPIILQPPRVKMRVTLESLKRLDFDRAKVRMP
jgi:hypothetical protein